jgi:hypothetical protein
MKVSTILSYAIFSLVLVFSTTLFAADAPLAKQATATMNKTTAKLPSVIKINQADVGSTTALIDLNMEKAKTAGKRISWECGKIPTALTKLEQSVSNMRNRVNECSNKSYTTEDQKKAKCTDDMTVAQCSKRLFNDCLKQVGVFDKVYATSAELIDRAQKMRNDAKELEESANGVMVSCEKCFK